MLFPAANTLLFIRRPGPSPHPMFQACGADGPVDPAAMRRLAQNSDSGGRAPKSLASTRRHCRRENKRSALYIAERGHFEKDEIFRVRVILSLERLLTRRHRSLFLRTSTGPNFFRPQAQYPGPLPLDSDLGGKGPARRRVTRALPHAAPGPGPGLRQARPPGLAAALPAGGEREREGGRE